MVIFVSTEWIFSPKQYFGEHSAPGLASCSVTRTPISFFCQLRHLALVSDSQRYVFGVSTKNLLIWIPASELKHPCPCNTSGPAPCSSPYSLSHENYEMATSIGQVGQQLEEQNLGVLGQCVTTYGPFIYTFVWDDTLYNSIKHVQIMPHACRWTILAAISELLMVFGWAPNQNHSNRSSGSKRNFMPHKPPLRRLQFT